METPTPKSATWHEFARITDESGLFNVDCEVPQAAAMLTAGILASFDGEDDHGYCAERLYTVIEANEAAVIEWLETNPVRTDN
jgi:hypothetical protein